MSAKATVRMYRYHAVTQGWGDIGYNYLVDEAGVIYKGRHSHAAGVATKTTPDTITGDDASGNVVRAGHAYGFNAGTVGVALLGSTLTNQDATTLAKLALEDFLAWEARLRGISADGSSNYVNPVDSTVKNNLPNIAGHLDVNSTECPGGSFYAGLPTIRKNVAAKVANGG